MRGDPSRPNGNKPVAPRTNAPQTPWGTRELPLAEIEAPAKRGVDAWIEKRLANQTSRRSERRRRRGLTLR